MVGLLPLLLFAVRVHGCGASGWVVSLLRAFGALFVAGLAGGGAAFAAWLVAVFTGGVKYDELLAPKPLARALIALASCAAWLAVALRLTRC